MKINLKFEKEDQKQAFFELLKNHVKIPICRNCGLLFSLGFPNSETGLADHLICEENGLICFCEYSKMVRNLYNKAKEDGVIDISLFYRKV